MAATSEAAFRRGVAATATETKRLTVMEQLRIRAYDTDRLIVVAAPMPGLEPTDIVVEVRADILIIRGEARGHYRSSPPLWIEEWRAGGYYRELHLPHQVDGALANVTYGNGILVVALPKAGASGAEQPANIQLTPLPDPTRGEHVGYFGRAILPTTTESHLRKHLSHVGAGGVRGPS
jgi:HSP20 family protein